MITATGQLTDEFWLAPEGPQSHWEKQPLQVWLIPAPSDKALLARLNISLSRAEQERAARFRLAQDKANFITARACLRRLLTRYLKCSPTDIAFQNNAHGKPELSGIHQGRIHFNISHSGAYCLLGFSHAEVGVDIEHWREQVEHDEIAERFFTVEEFQWIMDTPDRPEQSSRFYACWSLKEAYLKATGTGLSGSLKSLSVLPALVHAQVPLLITGNWRLQTLTTGLAGYSSAVCWADRETLSPRLFRWQWPVT